MNLSKLKKQGYALMTVLVFASISITVITGITVWFVALAKSGPYVTYKEQAFQIAESGNDYYRWHLAHSPADFKDGTATSGPYIHPFYDKDGNQIGTFSLLITPPATGTSIVTIQSTGKLLANPTISRTVTTKLAIPSFAKYSVVANSDMRFGADTEVFGPLHSNGGIRFDGLAHNLITSSLASYDDPDHTGANEFGVHTHVNSPPGTGINNAARPAETSPSPVPLRTDVFAAGRQFPVSTVDFNGITSDLSLMKTNAQASGKYFSFSGSLGYQIIFKTNDTFDVYRVTSLAPPPSVTQCTNTLTQSGWGTWSIQNKVFINNYPLPSNGLIFVDDNAWVEGTINTARVTVAAGTFPDQASTRRNITVNSDLLYTNYDGRDVIALIAQNNINVGMISDTNLRIDAALIAQKGRVGRYHYKPNSGSQNNCSPYHTRNSITLFGMIGTYARYGFSYTDNSGYINRTISYDSNLLYGPPPSFPLTSDQYQTIFWEEN